MSEKLELGGKVVVITGGSEGIGLGMATCLSRYGARIVIASRNSERGEKAVAAIAEDAGVPAEHLSYVQTDITREDNIQRMIEHTVHRFGRLDSIINNAVFPGDFKLLADEPAESFELVMKTNVTGVFFGMKHAIQQFLTQGANAGDNYSIINISSGATRDQGMTMAPYIASKLAVEGLTRAAALEYSRQGIRINTLLFGVFDTEKSRALHEAMPFVLEKNAAKHHVGRFGDPEKDAGEAAAFLISDRSGFVTGTNLFVDGGMCL